MLEDSIKDITKGASIIVVGMIITSVIGLVTQILMGRLLGPADYGLYNLGISVIFVICVLPNFGLGQGLTQFIPHNFKQKRYLEIKEAVNFSLIFTLVVGVFSAILLFMFSNQIALRVFHDSEFGYVLKILAIALPFWALHNLGGLLTQGYKKPNYYVYIENVSMPIILLSIFVILSILGYTLLGALLGFTISAVFASLAYIYIFRVKLDKKVDKNIEIESKKSIRKEILILSYPLFLAGFTLLFMQYADKIILGIYKTPTEVGIYTAALTIANIVIFLYTAFCFNSRPILAEYFAIKDFKSLRKLYSSLTRWLFLLTVPITIYIIFYSGDILKLIFGAKFTSGSLALSILSLGVAMNALTGISGSALISIRKPKLNLTSEIVGSVSNIALNILLIPSYGIIGAAVGTSISIALRNITSLFFILNILKINPYNTDYIKIIIYSVITLTVIYLLFSKLNISWAFLIVLPIFLVINYGILSLTHFFDESDQVIINQIKSKVNSIISSFL